MFKLGDNPVPGYALLRLIGRGQYGEVWEASGPGGTRLAIKIISLRENKGQIELKSIQAVKQVRHANLIPIHAIWLLDQEGKVVSEETVAQALAVSRHVQRDHTLIPDELRVVQSLSYLIICMAMADGNLEDRLRQAVAEGQPGIPPDELTRYIDQAAVGLDYLNSTRHVIDGTTVGIQHRDVKPANLLLLGDTVVVGDFGVATTLSEFDAMATAVLGSLAFMAPESLAQRPSQTSDQYALAITYYQLRFNQLPYDANVPLDQLIAIHKEGRLDFRLATPCERSVLKRATALEPRRRYGSCREFAEALATCFRPETTPRRAVLPAMALAAAATVLAAAALWYFDPGGWFRRPADQNQANSEQVYSITIPAEDVRGQLQILREGQPVGDPQPLAQLTSVKLAPGDEVQLRAESPNPFLAPLDARFTLDDLEQKQWMVALAPIPAAEIQGQLHQLLETGDLTAARELWERARKYDPNFNSIAQPKSLGIGLAVGFQISSDGSRLAIKQRDSIGEHLALLDCREDPWKLNPLPACPAERSPIESVQFVRETAGLVVARQRSIWRWPADGTAWESIADEGDSAATWRYLLVRVSADGRWIAAGDSMSRVRIWDATRTGEKGPLGEVTLDGSLVDLQFDREHQRLVVVSDAIPVRQIELSALTPAATGPMTLTATPLANQPALEGPVLIKAARWGTDSLALASEDAVTFAADLLTANPQPFTPLAEVPGGSLFLLVGAAEAGRVLSASDADPAGVVWDGSAGTSLRRLPAAQLVASIRDAAISADGHWCAISTHNGSLYLLDLQAPADDSSAWHTLDASTLGYFAFVGFSADSRYLWAISQPRTPNDASALLQWDTRRLQLTWGAK